jgi:MoaD family protein
MKIEVQLFGLFRDAAGVRRQEVPVDDDGRLDGLIETLAALYNPEFRDRVANTPGMRILINGQDSDLLDGMTTSLHDGDTIVFLPPMAGG